MKQLFGYLLAIGGGLLMAWVLVAGVGFSAILSVGCVGTKGREGCDQLGYVLGATAGGTLLGWLLYRWGRALARRQPPAGP